MTVQPPQRVVRALAERRTGREDARLWLDEVPRLVEEALRTAGLTAERTHVPGGRSSVVVLVRTEDGAPAVLKLAPPVARPTAERAALRCWDGTGAVRLLPAGDLLPEGALLLERLRPDVSVRTLPEAKSMLEAAGTLRRLWVEPAAAAPDDQGVFETVAERTGRQARAMAEEAALDSSLTPLVDAALAARTELLAAPPAPRLLHGTLRQSKVLAAERSPWLAVGPDPVVGECAFDLARLVRDRVEDLVAQPSGAAVLRRRIKKLAESLEVDTERLRGWTLFRAVESGARSRRVGRHRDAELLLEFAGWL